MTAKQVSVGLTYNVKFGDEFQPVTLTRTCEWGGWYGRNESDGTTVRIATAGRLHGQVNGTAAREARIADNIPIHVLEAPMPTTTPAQREARASRRKPAATSTPIETPKETTVSNTTASKPKSKPKAKPKAAANTRNAKPAAKKPAARRSGTVKLSGAVATEAKQATLLTQEQADQMVAAAVAKAMAEYTGVAPTASRKIAAKSNDKPVVITLEPRDPKVNSYSFKYVGKDETPLVSAVYLTIPLLEQFAENGDAVEIDFAPYVPRGKQKQMPKSKIRYSGTEDSIRDLYVDRKGITALGYSETNCPTVTVAVIKGNRITLTFQAANKG